MRSLNTNLLLLSGALLVLVLLEPAKPGLALRDTSGTSGLLSSHGRHSMMHNHLSRKVFERACAASKDTIDEIVACMTNNEALIKAVNPKTAANCHKEAFGLDFDPKDIGKHKDLICNNRDKFEQLTACIYRKTAEVLDRKEMDQLTEAIVDVGLCIINALDG